MHLTIVLRKEVPDEATAQQLVNIVCEKLEGHEVEIAGKVNQTLIIPVPE